MILCYDLLQDDVNVDSVRRWLSRLSDDELIGEYSFMRYIDDYTFPFGGDTDLCIYLSNYAIFVCEEIAKRYFNYHVFKEVF